MPKGNVASVDENGVATAEDIGDADIIAYDKDKNIKYHIKVRVKVNPKTVVANNDQDFRFNVKLIEMFVDGKCNLMSHCILNSRVLKWTSSDTKVAVVNQKGVVSAKNTGISRINVTDPFGRRAAITLKFDAYSTLKKTYTYGSHKKPHLPKNFFTYAYQIGHFYNTKKIKVVDITFSISALASGCDITFASSSALRGQYLYKNFKVKYYENGKLAMNLVQPNIEINDINTWDNDGYVGNIITCSLNFDIYWSKDRSDHYTRPANCKALLYDLQCRMPSLPLPARSAL